MRVAKGPLVACSSGEQAKRPRFLVGLVGGVARLGVETEEGARG